MKREKNTSHWWFNQMRQVVDGNVLPSVSAAGPSLVSSAGKMAGSTLVDGQQQLPPSDRAEPDDKPQMNADERR